MVEVEWSVRVVVDAWSAAAPAVVTLCGWWAVLFAAEFGEDPDVDDA